MRLSHTRPVVSAIFDKPELGSVAGLVPMLGHAARAGPHELSGTWLSVLTDKRATAGVNVASLVGGIVAGADSACYGHAAINAALAGGAYVSVAVWMDPAVKWMDPAVKRTIASIGEDASARSSAPMPFYDADAGSGPPPSVLPRSTSPLPPRRMRFSTYPVGSPSAGSRS